MHNLKLTPLKEKKNGNKAKKMTKFALLNNLYHKYSITLPGYNKKGEK